MRIRLLVSLCMAAFGFRAGAVDKALVLDTETTWNGSPIEYFETRCPEVELVLVTIHPGEATGIHLHPVNNYAYMVKGTVSLESGDVDASGKFIKNERYKTAQFGEGQAFAELVNTWHNGVNNTTEDVQILVWYTTEKGYAVTVSWASNLNYKPDRHMRDSSLCQHKSPPWAK